MIRSAGKLVVAALALGGSLPASTSRPRRFRPSAAPRTSTPVRSPTRRWRDFSSRRSGTRFRPAARAPLADWPLERWDLDTLTLAALYHHPTPRRGAGAVAIVAAAGVPTAGARPNPTLSHRAASIVAKPARRRRRGSPPSALDWPIETAGKRARPHRARASARDGGALALDATEAWRVRRECARALVDGWRPHAQRGCGARGARSRARASSSRCSSSALRAGAASSADVAPLASRC